MTQIFIKYLPKHKLLYALWQNAKISQYLYYCREKAPTLTLHRCKKDIKHMLTNNKKIDVTTYYGRLLYVDITGEYLDAFNYDIHNGDNRACHIVNELKKEEILRTILSYYKGQ